MEFKSPGKCFVKNSDLLGTNLKLETARDLNFVGNLAKKSISVIIKAIIFGEASEMKCDSLTSSVNLNNSVDWKL